MNSSGILLMRVAKAKVEGAVLTPLFTTTVRDPVSTMISDTIMISEDGVTGP
jgi:hypothetical protein